jgi:hypothetical protein
VACSADFLLSGAKTDFDLLFGAAKLNLRIIDLPIRYQAAPTARRTFTAGGTGCCCCA